jgi:putative transposase
MSHSLSQSETFENHNIQNFQEGKFLTSFQRKALLKSLQGDLQPE